MTPVVIFILSIAFMITFIPTIFLNIALLWTRLLGYKIRIKEAGFLRFKGIEFISKQRVALIGEVVLNFHYPRYTSPFFLSIIANRLENREPHADTSIQRVTIRCLLFPVQLCFSGGPWIECQFEDFSVHVYGSRSTPEWLAEMRDNVVNTVLTGETIRLNSLETKSYFQKSTTPRSVDGTDDSIYVDRQPPVTAGLDKESNEISSVEMDQSPPAQEKAEQDDVRVRGTASQWHIFNPKNVRMYTFDNVQADLRRSWFEGRGSFVMITKDCRWTKVARTPQDARNTRWTKAGPVITPRGFLSGVLSLVYILPISMINVLEMINIDITRMDITFDDFHIRDAKALKAGFARLEQEYIVINQKHPGLVEEVAWDTFGEFVNSIVAACC